MYKYAKYSLITFILFILCMILYIVISTYINDPLQIWHKPYFRPVKYSHMRESAQARMRNNKFDSIIIGNSYSECTSSKEAGKILGGKFINLSMSGSNMPEKKLVLEYALKHYNIKKVVYIFDEHYLNLERESKYTDNWTILYDNNPFNDITVYLNNKYLPCNLLFCNMKNSISYTDIDKAQDWEKEVTHSRRFGGFENWEKYYPEDEQISRQFKSIYDSQDKLFTNKIDDSFKNGIEDYFNEYIFSLVKSNPDVEFDFVMSPKCNIELALNTRCSVFNKIKYALQVFVKTNEQYKNSKLFAFDNEDCIGQVEDFKDGTHYRSWINYYILKSIKDNRNELTEENVDQYITIVETKINKFEDEFKKYKQRVKEIYKG